MTGQVLPRKMRGVFSIGGTNHNKYKKKYGLQSLLAASVTASLLSITSISTAHAVNCTANASPQTRTLGTSGIQCNNRGVSQLTVNSNGTVNISNIDGVQLTRSGTSGNGGIDTNNSVHTATSNNGTPDDDSDDYDYLVTGPGSTTPIRDDDGNIIRVIQDTNGNDVLTDANGNPLPLDKLDNYIASGADAGGAAIAIGDVTLINSANMNVNNGRGLVARAKGGNGGKGGTGSILFYSWGYDGGRGSDGGSVAVTNDGNITTSGSGRHGVYASSEGGKGGDGGGFFGLIVSDPGGGGNGGRGGTVNVDLLSNSSINTSGSGAHGVLAESLGGNGGAGGSSSGAVALGNDGGDGGAGGSVAVNNDGSIRTTGRGAYGIFARSYGAGAGSGSGSGGIVALGGNGGGFASGGNVTVTNSGDIETTNFGSHGVLAHSIGGGGGDGGNAGGLFTVGGKAGSGGNGGVVRYTQNGGSVITHGDKANAVYAQSIGGGGGNGGNATSIGVGVTVAVGGSGGPGGNGNSVIVNVQDTSSVISTAGDESSGIIAQSIGGGGGNGGYGVSGNISPSGSVSVGIGGAGSNGGSGGIVDVTNYATITTGNSSTGKGERSYGVIAQSIGGGGGNGGLAVAASASMSGSVSVGIGGSAGGGGSANTVDIDNHGQISTGGYGAHGIFGQSIGGGGGSGGASVAASISGGASVNVGLGGTGGSGGSSQKVTINNTNTIQTAGNSAHGILGQSVGGGGGSGGLSVTAGIGVGANVNVGLGGNGGTGGSGHQVVITNSGDITTTGNSSSGVVAQSIGGGGGNGGFNFSGGFSTGGTVSVGLGGSGANGGSGNQVNLTNSGTIVTTGSNSFGLHAQSVGGGGGTGGGNFSFAGAGGIVGGSVSVGLGGTGGSGNNAGRVVLNNSGNIYTTEEGSHAVVAQSIGGGGGAGGWSVGASGAIGAKGSVAVAVSLGGKGGSGSTAGVVEVTDTSNLLYTRGNDAYGILAQSIGGGGGIGGFSGAGAFAFSGQNGSGAVSVSLGGQGGGGGTGQAVTVNNTGNIVTLGDRGHGLVAQSLGGGGGAGGGSISISASGSSGVGLSAGVALGGSGGGGGQSGAVNVTNNGNIQTSGDDAYGILAQSLGGSGGSGGFSGAGAFAFSSKGGAGAATVSLGGSGGSGARSGAVTVNQTGDIYTSGDRAHGLVAQSIGGSGGSGGTSVTVNGAIVASDSLSVGVSLGGSGGTGGIGETVSVNFNGDVTTGGDDAYGILAQSIGGSGGSGGFSFSGSFSTSKGSGNGAVNVSLGGDGGSGGISKAVSVNHNGDIQTTGDRSHGLVAQSLGGSGGAGGGSIAVAGNAGSLGLNVGVSLGGDGGNGGTAGNVTVLNDGKVSTQGEGAHGIIGQSVGGSGGSGGFSIAGTLNVPPTGSLFNLGGSVSVSLGGAGGNGGTGGDVAVGGTFDSNGSFVRNAITDSGAGVDEFSIVTTGNYSHGIVGQSVGGSGGSGGFSGAVSGVSFPGSSAPNTSSSISVTLGGTGGKGSVGGDVYVANEANIAALGDHSYGILAQSIGGNGGTGGGSIGGAFGGSSSLNAAVSLGGFGGEGSRAGIVNVSNSGTILTGDQLDSQNGQFSHGILAQSIGGNGGAAGWSGSLAFSGSESYNMSVSIGGFGGDGADGNTVIVNNDGTILVSGDHSHGIMAQSIGGGGGTGGDTGLDKGIWGESGAFGSTGSGTGDNSLAFIGNSAIDDVASGNADEIDTGAGGAYSGSTGANTMSLSVSVGGFGGDGGLGGNVNVTNDGVIFVGGTSGHGIYAQSVGGGGGAGGVSTAASGAVNASNTGTFAISVGGFGGKGGHGGAVNVTNNGTIVALGQGGYGVFAQSVGGGGGDGGDSRGFTLQRKAGIDPQLAKQFQATVGGFGGAAGDGGNVNVTNDGLILTTGAAAHGIFAQSVGGGGGTGGLSKTSNEELSALLENDKKEDKILNLKKLKIAVGGFGGGGGQGGDVTVINDVNGTIITLGDASNGIFAQSIGGGGGEGGRGDSGFSGSLSIGGWGGNAGDGGTVTVTNSGTIQTSGTVSSAIFAQSIGGGGGNGGSADFGSIRSLRNEMIKNIRKNGLKQGPVKFLKDMFLKPTLGVAVGGFAGAAGDGGYVNINNEGDLYTTGDLSHGIHAQSVGGGGGTGGTAHLSNLGKIGIGGMGGAAGEGGNVDVTHSGNIITTGVGSYGIFAQSVGGGGGIAGDISLGVKEFGISVRNLTQLDGDIVNDIDGVDATVNSSGFVDSINIIGQGSSAFFDLLTPGDGNGGNVTVNSNGLIYVQGGNSDDVEERAGSIGIFAQSVGGGGGIVGTTIEITEAEVGIDVNEDGDFDDVFDVQTGQGFAGSVGGSGKGGEVVVNHSGSILSPSYNGVGVFAQSVGGDGGSDITINLTNGGDITLPDGTVQSGGVIMGGVLADDGTGTAAAIIIDGGNNNTINLGTGTRVFALSDRAIIASDGLDAVSGANVAVGNETINSHGMVIGIVDVGDGTNAYNNKSGGEFITSTLVNLGANTNLLTNETGGVINPYAMELAGTTELRGGFVQQNGGTYIVDASFDNPANNVGDTDLINATGKVDLQGLVAPNLLYLSDDTRQLILTSGTNDVTVGADVQDTLVVDFSLENDQSNVWLTINSVDFSIDGFTPNQTATGDHFNDIVMNSNIGADQTLSAVMADLANLPNNDDSREKLAFALDHLHSEPYLAQQMSMLFTDINFLGRISKCETASSGVNIVNGNCIWGEARVNRFEKGRTYANIGTEVEMESIAGGYQRALSNNTIAGISFMYGHGDMNVDDRLRSDYFKAAKGGAFLKYRTGNFQFSLGGSYGYTWYDDNVRNIRFYRTTGNDFTGRLNGAELVELQTTGRSAVESIGAKFQAAYTHRMQSLYLKPFVDLNLNYIRFSEFRETGAEGLNLVLSDTGNTFFSVMPGLELGADFKFANGLKIRPFVSVGALFFDDAVFKTGTSFEGSPSDVGPFDVTSEFDDVIGTLKAGINLSNEEEGFDLKLKYEGKFSDDIDEHSGTVNFSIDF